MKIKKITLDKPITYKIKIPGTLNENWLDWDERISIEVKKDLYPEPISLLTVNVDQAELHGLLQLLYSFGIPLISVECQYYSRNQIG